MENKKEDKISWGMILGIGFAVWITGTLIFNGLDLFRDGKAMQGFGANGNLSSLF